MVMGPTSYPNGDSALDWSAGGLLVRRRRVIAAFLDDEFEIAVFELRSVNGCRIVAVVVAVVGGGLPSPPECHCFCLRRASK